MEVVDYFRLRGATCRQSKESTENLRTADRTLSHIISIYCHDVYHVARFILLLTRVQRSIHSVPVSYSFISRRLITLQQATCTASIQEMLCII